MIQIKLLSIPSEQQLASILAYTTSTIVSNSGEITTDISNIATIKHIFPEVTFAVNDNKLHTCIVQTTLPVSEVKTKAAGATVTEMGLNLYKVVGMNAGMIDSFINDPQVVDVQSNNTEMTLLQFVPQVYSTPTSTYVPGSTDAQIDLASITPNVVADLSVNWALPRIFNRVAPFETTVKFYTPIKQEKTSVYLMDSGINLAHTEFNNNVENLFSIIPNNFDDHNGHGTSLASAIVGKTVGVTPNFVTVKNVKIFDPAKSTTLEDLVTAFNAIAQDVIANPGVCVVNMSWVISKNTIIEGIIQHLIDNLNVMFVCAAGNSGLPIELVTPASMKTVITVGAVDETNSICAFTNYNIDAIDPTLPLFGQTALDLFAPGKNVMAASHLDVNAYIASTGTSIAAAYVSAVAAYSALLQYPTVTKQPELFALLVENSTKEVINITDPKYALMPNRIVWCIHDCDEILDKRYYIINRIWTPPLVDTGIATTLPDLFEAQQERLAVEANIRDASNYLTVLSDHFAPPVPSAPTFSSDGWPSTELFPPPPTAPLITQSTTERLLSATPNIGVVSSTQTVPLNAPFTAYVKNNNYFNEIQVQINFLKEAPLDLELSTKQYGAEESMGCTSSRCLLVCDCYWGYHSTAYRTPIRYRVSGLPPDEVWGAWTYVNERCAGWSQWCWVYDPNCAVCDTGGGGD